MMFLGKFERAEIARAADKPLLHEDDFGQRSIFGACEFSFSALCFSAQIFLVTLLDVLNFLPVSRETHSLRALARINSPFSGLL